VSIDSEFVNLKIGCFIAVTINTDNPRSLELPENFKTLFRYFAMAMPELELIAEVLMCSVGFSKAKELAKKINLVLKMCQDLVSRQNGYIFGIRTLKQIL